MSPKRKTVPRMFPATKIAALMPLVSAWFVVGVGAETPKAPVPGSPFLPIVYRYADDLLENGRDTPVGSNTEHEQNLLRLLYTLSELSTKPKYREAADAALRRFLESATPAKGGTRESSRPWLLWDRCFDLAPDASKRVTLGLLEQTQHGVDSPRQAGFSIRTLAMAFDRTGDERLPAAIQLLLARFEAKRSEWTASELSMAIDCDGAAHHVPEPLATRLRAFAAREDDFFCALPHDIQRSGGFVTAADAATGNPNGSRTPRWATGAVTTAQMGLLCVSRYENTGKVAYRDLIHAAADAYLDSLPPAGMDAWPVTFGHAISLELAAWRSTARQVYLDRARELANRAVEKFFGKSSPPRASVKTDDHESLTGADTLALALVELHLHILHITAVRCPTNSADR